MAVAAFGSWARGEHGEGSDVDVLVILDPSIPLRRNLYDDWDEKPLCLGGLPVQVHLVHLPEDPEHRGGLWAEVALDGIVLFERALILSRTLARVRRGIPDRTRGVPAGWRPGGLGTGEMMQNRSLAADYVRRATIRLKALEVLFEAESWADVVRESQEAAELALKGLLREYGIEPPRIYDVSEILLAERQRFPEDLQPHVEELASISRSLRRDRELAFYGAEDLTPSGFYRREDARRAMDAARRAASCVEPFVAGSA
ncbi:MAG: HEPN domain-containing protein [Acidobacteria bacterium]|nr:HEPN domain-containing protein [Acidobacteriota bacterium]